jgi:hypothetical protein
MAKKLSSFQKCMKKELSHHRRKGRGAVRKAFKQAAKKCSLEAYRGRK